MLPAHDALPGPSRAHAHLLGWARLTAGQPELLCQNESELAAMTVEDRKAIRLAAGLLWGKLAVAQGNMESAQKALRLVEELAGTQRREEAMIAWGLNAFERGAAPAIEWFSSHTDGQDGTAPSAARFALALAEFRNGQLSEGRALVERLAQEWPPDNADSASLRWQSCVLSALSHLAATREWAASGNASVGKQDDSPRELTPFLEELGLAPDAAENVIAKSAADYVKRLRSKHKEAVENLAVKLKKRQITKNECEEKRESLRGDLDHELREFHELRTGAAIHQRHAARAASEVEDLPEEDPPAREREIKAKNRALWAAARDRITPLLDRLGEAPAQWSWWKPFISGLLAYADHNATLGSDEIARFAAAIEHVESPAARTRLREIEASLVSRANAVEQVCSLIREKRHAELREFNESVLIHFVESIPATVRAAVHMTLWNADPDYNPLPQLLRISAEPADAGLIGQCVAEVKTAQAMSQLAQSLRTRSTAALPSFEQLGDADAKVTSPARLAAAVMYLRDDELMAAAGQLSSLPQDSRDPAVVYARFYLSWRQGDGASCVVQLARSDESNLYSVPGIVRP
jgi:hypothetical protein